MKADFSKIIRDSIRITKINKKLWVMGLVLVALGAGGGSGGSNFSQAFKDTKQNTPDNSVDQVLGSATTSVTELLKTIPPTYYVFLAVTLLVLISVGIAVSLYGKSWAQSGLIKGIEQENLGRSLSLKEMSDYGKRQALEVIKLKLYPSLILILVITLLTTVVGALTILLPKGSETLLVLLAVPFGLLLIPAVIYVIVGQFLGTLAINLESLTWKQAFKRGTGLFKTYILDIFILSVINGLAGCVVGIVTLIGVAVFGGIGAAAVLGAVNWLPFMVAAGPIVFLAILCLIMLLGLCGTILTVFKQSTWVLLYNSLRSTEVTTNGQQ